MHSMAIENFPDSHAHHHHEIVKKSNHMKEANQHFSCDLSAYSSQCREYEILENAKTTLEEIHDGCESMGGVFSQQKCPTTIRLSICSDIIRNYHQPDVIYSNIYYKGAPADWDIKTTERVCGDLGGEFLSE